METNHAHPGKQAGISDRHTLIALLMCCLLTLCWTALLTVKFNFFGYYDWDLALAAQTLWNLTHGSTHVSLYGMNFLGNHAEYAAFLLAPLYKIFPSPLLLIYLKVISFFSAAFVLFLLARRVFSLSWYAYILWRLSGTVNFGKNRNSTTKALRTLRSTVFLLSY